MGPGRPRSRPRGFRRPFWADFRPSGPPFWDFSNILVKTRQNNTNQKAVLSTGQHCHTEMGRGGLPTWSPGGSRRSFLEGFWDDQAERPTLLINILISFRSFVYALFCLSSVAFLAAWPAAPRICKNLENPLVFVVRKPYAPFSRSARSNQISEGTHSKQPLKAAPKKGPTGPEQR